MLIDLFGSDSELEEKENSGDDSGELDLASMTSLYPLNNSLLNKIEHVVINISLSIIHFF